MISQLGEILLYGTIAADDVSAKEFMSDLQQQQANQSTVKIRINSPGGSVFEGIAIINAMRQCKKPIDVYIDGLAASMASAIAISGSRAYMSSAAMFMTHKATCTASGNADDMRSTAAMIEHAEAIICEMYARKTGLTKEQAKSKFLSDQDNWMTADQALQAKLVDSIYDAQMALKGSYIPKNEKLAFTIYNSHLKSVLGTSTANLYENLSWHQLDRAGLLPTLKEKDFSLFNSKFHEEFGRDWSSNKVQSLPGKGVAHNIAVTPPTHEHDIDELNEKKVTALLAKAIVQNDITEDIAKELKEAWSSQPEALPDLISSFAAQRFAYLNSLDFDELDKKGKLAEELMQRYLPAYKLKRYTALAKKQNGKMNNDDFYDWGRKNGYISEGQGTMIILETETNTWEKINDNIYNMIYDSCLGFLDASWDRLSPINRERAKEECFRSYQRMYFEKFGIICKEPFIIEKLNK